jgi:type I restriction enzyme R subunit
MSQIKIISQNNDSTVVEEYIPIPKNENSFQSEAELEQKFIELLKENGYEYVNIKNNNELKQNLRIQIEKLNKFQFTDNE